MAKQNILTTEKFIENVIERHGVLFDYSNVVYLGSKYKIEVGCHYHGMFWLKAGNPIVFNQDEFNTRTNKTFGELYAKTLNKIVILVENGYKIVDIWESEWKEMIK